MIAATQPGHVKVQPGDRLLLIGDSLGVGLKPHLAKLSQEFGTHLLAKPRGGTVIPQWLRGPDGDWLKKALADFKPTHVLVSLGTNDAYSNFIPEQVRLNLQALVRLIQDSGAKVVWIGPPRLPERYGTRSPNVGTLRVVDTAPNYFDSRPYDIPRSDGLHATVKGYAGWAGAFWNWLT